MRQTVFKKFHLSTTVVLVTTGLVGSIDAVAAQENTPVCQPPRVGEYLLLVVSPTAASQDQVLRALPPNIDTTICRYLKDTVTRIGGFTRSQDASDWARYLNDIVGLSTFVTARPAPTPPSNQPGSNPNNPNPPRYNPKPLGSGYAVLVDYFNRPEIANQVRRLLANDVGLVSYAQRPYLLAVYTKNQTDANSILQRLSDRGFFAMLVDSRKVTLLGGVVSLE